MTIKSITGTLTPRNPSAITKQTTSKINTAANTANLTAVIKPSPAWHHGIIVTNQRPTDGLTGLEFLSRLRKLIHAEGIEELALEGKLIVQAESRNHFKGDFTVTVKAGNIFCEEVKSSRYFIPEEPELTHTLTK